MFRILNFANLIRYVAFSTTVVSLVVYEIVHRYWLNDLPIVRVLSIAPWVSFLILWILTTNWIARAIWCLLGKFNGSLFPDLNGTWEGEILTENNNVIPVRALVKQSLFHVQIDVHTETSKSQTLESTPTAENGQFKLYYMYRSMPKDPSWDSYTGSTIFDVRRVCGEGVGVLELSGTYHTSRKSRGRIRLRKTDGDVNSDVSFY